MPFEGKTIMERRLEFVLAATQPGANRAALYRHYGIDPKTGRKWIARYLRDGEAGLEDHSRRPQRSPRISSPEVENAVLDLRAQHPTWGGRKLAARLTALGLVAPAPSTITAILGRHGCLTPVEREPAATRRFEAAAPNHLWQMDFKGHRALAEGRVYPLSILDDHSRFAIALVACASEHRTVVHTALITCFRTYGLPVAMLVDNGSPWGHAGDHVLTRLEAWLIRLGIRLLHGRPRHPQTQGKVERWHRTIEAELFQFAPFRDLAAAQRGFDRFRDEYNLVRPHEAIELEVPASRYHPSHRCYPEELPPIVYSDTHQVRKVSDRGRVCFGGRRHFIGEAFQGQPVGIRPTHPDGVFIVQYCDHEIARLDLRRDPAT